MDENEGRREEEDVDNPEAGDLHQLLQSPGDFLDVKVKVKDEDGPAFLPQPETVK